MSSDRDRQKDGITAGMAVIIVAGAVAIYFLVSAQPESVDQPPPLPPMSSVQCERVVETEIRDGIIAGHPQPATIAVDQGKWAAMGTADRAHLLDMVACAAFEGRVLDQLLAGEDVRVTDAATGQPIATGSADGVKPAG